MYDNSKSYSHKNNLDILPDRQLFLVRATSFQSRPLGSQVWPTATHIL